MASSLIAIHGKGGTGKSTVARYLVHRLSAAGGVVAFDGDASNGTLTRFHRDLVSRVPTDDPAGVAHWLEQTVWPAAAAGQTVVLDLGSGAERVFTAWAADAGLLAVAEDAQVAITLVGVLDPSKDALVPAKAAVEALPGARHVMVRNAGRVKPGEDFQVINQHSAWQAIVAAGVTVVDMPMLQATMPTLDRLNAPFADAVAGCVRDGAAQISPFDRQRVTLWLRAMDQAFAPVLG